MRIMGFDVSAIWFLGILALGVMLCHDQQKMVALAEDCQQDLRGFMIECMYYMAEDAAPIQDPNGRCCKVIHSANIPCCCRHLNQKLLYPPWKTYEDMLDWSKVLHCMKHCGRPLSPGFNCAKFRVPAAAGPPSK